MSERILEVNHITMRFGGLCAVNDVSCFVDKGEIVGVIGPNGAGKTTFFNMLTGIYEPTSGTVEYRGVCLNKKEPHEITTMGIARTFQNIRLFDSMTVLDNVLTGLHCRTKGNLLDALFQGKHHRQREQEAEKRAMELLQLTGLSDYAYSNANSLAYGLRRKLEIARAMAADPEILLLAEPAAGMNERETEELTTFIHQVNDMGYTIILIEHNVKLVMELSNRIYVLNHGELLASGYPDEVKHDRAVIEAYLGKEVE